MSLPTGTEPLFYSIIVAHLIISVIIIIVGFTRKTERTKNLPILFIVNLAIFLTASFVGSTYLQFGKSMDFFAFMGYVVIGSYVIAIEIPGYLILSKYDSDLTKILLDTRKKIIDLNYKIEGTGELNTYCQSNKKMLDDVSLYSIIDSFVKRCIAISNLDQSLYQITIKEIGEQVNVVSNRSKHPFPKLIEIMSLAGISFLLSQFLNHFFS